MEGRRFEVTLVSANNLPNVRSFGQMKVYSEISVNEETTTTQKTPVDRNGKLNPTWNYRASFMVTESVVQQPGANVVVKLFCERTMGDRFIGEVSIPVKSLFDRAVEAQNTLSYKVEGTPNGVLKIRYRFGERTSDPEAKGWKRIIVRAGVSALIQGTIMAVAAVLGSS